MALIKELKSTYGVSPSYHRVTSISLNAMEKEAIVCVGSYLSKEAREKGCDPIDAIDILVPKEDYPRFLEGNAFKAAYGWLRENVVGLEDAKDD